KPRFRELMFRRGDPCFFAFDLLMGVAKDYCRERLEDRKQELRRVLARVPADSLLRYTEYINSSGIALFERVCKMDLASLPSISTLLTSVSENRVRGTKSGI